MEIEAALVDMPRDIDVIIGIDSQLSKVNFSKQEAFKGEKFVFQITADEDDEIFDDEAVTLATTKHPALVQQVLDKHVRVFAVENWSTISTLPAVDIHMSKCASPVRCPK